MNGIIKEIINTSPESGEVSFNISKVYFDDINRNFEVLVNYEGFSEIDGENMFFKKHCESQLLIFSYKNTVKTQNSNENSCVKITELAFSKKIVLGQNLNIYNIGSYFDVDRNFKIMLGNQNLYVFDTKNEKLV